MLIGGRMHSMRWTHAGLVRSLCRGLSSRGHQVVLACMSVDDASWFAPSRVVAMGAHDESGSDWRPGFAGWARRAAAGIEADVVISTSRVAWGDVWLPLGPSASAWLTQAACALGPVGAGKSLYKHTGVLAARALEIRRPWPRGPRGRRPARVAVIGADAAGCAKDALASHRLDTRVVALPFVSTCDMPGDAARARSRIELRRVLGLREADTLALISCVGLVGDSLSPVFEAAARVNDRLGRTGRPGKLIVAVLARDAYHAHDAAVRAEGAAAWVRVLGTTSRIESVLSAADVAVVPRAMVPDPFMAGTAARFTADALSMARPVLAADGAPGIELISSLPGLGEPGAVVRHDGVEPLAASWERALARAMEPQWRDRSLLAAAAAGTQEKLGLPRFVDALETLMTVSATERRKSPGLGR